LALKINIRVELSLFSISQKRLSGSVDTPFVAVFYIGME
jgi:hypothetical protein